VGRAKTSEGPFLDADGTDLKETVSTINGTIVFPRDADGFIGAGHAGIYAVNETHSIFTNHFEASPQTDGRTLDASWMTITEEGWIDINEMHT